MATGLQLQPSRMEDPHCSCKRAQLHPTRPLLQM